MGSLLAGPVALWLPILVSAVLVFIASSIIHMGPFWHRGDYPALPREGEVQAALRPLAIPPGEYMLPRAGSMALYKTPEFTEKLRAGPVALLTVLPSGPIDMGRNLRQWFVSCWWSAPWWRPWPDAHCRAAPAYPQVFRIAAAVAFIAYAVALAELSIWYRRSWTLTLKGALGGLIYGLLTGGTFGWLWPH